MIYELVLGDLQEHCYIFTNDNKTCVIIDAGDEYEKIIDFVNSKNLQIIAVLLTHGHFDHCGACKQMQDDGVIIYIHKYDADKLYTDNNMSKYFGYNFKNFYADYLLDEGEIKIANYNFKVLHTPGHSKGSVCYIYENNIFCGDTIFENGYGRTDFYDGSIEELRDSIKKIMPYINEKYNLFYGH